MKSKVLRLSVVTLLSLGIWLTVVKHNANAQAQHVRWDIIPATGDIRPGGSASATAADGSTITLTGSGTFVAPAGGSGSSGAATGGGKWEISPPPISGASSGTYQVDGLVRFDEAPGSLTGVNDDIGDLKDAHAGLAILRISYSDGDRGVLVFSCSLTGSPLQIPEGVSASKRYVDFFNIVQEPVTIFHIAD
jgi:hypothetical protein